MATARPGHAPEPDAGHAVPRPVGAFDGDEPPDWEGILDCMHCGICLPQCPTYRVLGQEMDSPRGRVYLMRAASEGRMAYVGLVYCPGAEGEPARERALAGLYELAELGGRVRAGPAWPGAVAGERACSAASGQRATDTGVSAAAGLGAFGPAGGRAGQPGSEAE